MLHASSSGFGWIAAMKQDAIQAYNVPSMYRPGNVVIFGSQAMNSPLQYCCVCGTWNGSSCVEKPITPFEL